MQTDMTKPTIGVSDRSRGGQKKQLLLVGGEEVFESVVMHRIFAGHGFRISGKSTTLLDALARLEPGAIDLVILGREFREEELLLFAFDARRRGFAGLILRVAPTPRELMGATLHQISAQHAPPIVQATLVWNELQGPISFTVKEQAVLTRVSEGWTNQQIAHDLKCSEGAVKGIVQQLFKKLRVRKRARLVRMAFEKAFTQIRDGYPSVYAARIQGHRKKAASVGNPSQRGMPETHLKTDPRPASITKRNK